MKNQNILKKGVFLIFFLVSISYCQSTVLEKLLPKHSSNDQIIKHTAYILKYNEMNKQSEWIIYSLSKNQIKGPYNRGTNFRKDTAILTGSAIPEDYSGSGFDRGHLVPAADMKWSETAMEESFFMSNICPQQPGFNRGIWAKLEVLIRSWAGHYGKIFIVTGPVLSDGLSTIGLFNQISVPQYFYKVVLAYEKPNLLGIGFILPNQSSNLPIYNYAVTIDSVENLTNIDFFPALPDKYETEAEGYFDLKKWFFNDTGYQIAKKDPFKPLNENYYPSDNQSLVTTPQSASILSETSNAPLSTQDNSIVYITRSGSKYHKTGCSYLRSSSIPIPIEEAKAKGWLPCSKCFNENFPASQNLTSKPSVGPSEQVESTVYITRTGEKYHSPGCRYLRLSAIPISFEDAKAQRYTPCSVCGGGGTVNDREKTVSPRNKSTLPEYEGSTPKYENNNRTIYTGPRGGKYYINSRGNKTYISSRKRK